MQINLYHTEYGLSLYYVLTSFQSRSINWFIQKIKLRKM